MEIRGSASPFGGDRLCSAAPSRGQDNPTFGCPLEALKVPEIRGWKCKMLLVSMPGPDLNWSSNTAQTPQPPPPPTASLINAKGLFFLIKSPFFLCLSIFVSSLFMSLLLQSGKNLKQELVEQITTHSHAAFLIACGTNASASLTFI